ncbi:activator-dependent family glycosyltransferase [Streptomyces sp. A5-4]|uniref:activator-dependent family glycosyltransferase n=1 Tax=Streptomyces sp. A5-4 TaxID=3384771 RepID=UPI003DA94924
MRVLFAAFPLPSHLYPMIPLAHALQTAGHEVVVATQPGTFDPDMLATVVAAGLQVVPLGVKEDLDDMVRARFGGTHPELRTDALALTEDAANWESVRHSMVFQWKWHYRVESPVEDSRPVVDHLVDFARAWQPDLVLWDPLFFPAPIAARAVGAAHARVLFGLDNVGLVRQKGVEQLRGEGRSPDEDPLVTWMRPMLQRYGMEYDEELLLGQWTIDPQRTGHRLPLDYRYLPVSGAPYNGVTVVPEWLREKPRRPRVCLTLGQTGRPRLRHADSEISIRELMEMVAGLDVEVVATLNADQRAVAGPIPDNVRTVDYLPLNLLLPSCAAIVHHGGPGTTAAAAVHGVPQLIVPYVRWDEPVQSRYVADRGAGIAIPDEELSVEALRKALEAILGEASYREGAAALRTDVGAAPSPNELVPVLERLTRAQRRGGEHAAGR